MSLNTISITGRIAKDVEVRYSKDGLALVSLTIPDNQGSGENKKTVWFDVTFFGKQAETIGQFFKMGSNIAISGRIQEAHAYISEKTGEPGASIRVIGNAFGFVDAAKQADEGF